METAEASASRKMAHIMRRWIIEQSLASNVGHIGSALSITDIVAVLWNSVMRDPGTQEPDRDRFLLCKGHAALALYCALRCKGLLSEEVFKTYCKDGSLLTAHPEHELPGIELSTGSLGQGLSVGCGLAYAFKLKNSPARVFALMSDAECNEGQVWEAAMFAAHHKLDNLIAVIDLNGLQALGYTRDVLDLSQQESIWKSMGWNVIATDGHDAQKLLQVFNAPPLPGRPTVVVARTVLGKHVSFMENKLEWHYRNLNPELAAKALQDLECSL